METPNSELLGIEKGIRPPTAEITKISGVVHGSPSERELHFDVKNTGATTIDIDGDLA